MMQFADSVGMIQVYNQVVRIELLAASGQERPQPAENQPPLMAPVGHLMMPIDGLIQTFNAIEKTMQQLAEAGIIKRVSQGGGAGPGAPAMTGSAGGKKRPT